MTRASWTQAEIDLLRHLAACLLSPEEIADAFALIGWPVRTGGDLMDKAKRLNIKFCSRERPFIPDDGRG